MITLNALLAALIVVAAVGCALIGGVFFAFSTFVMQALDRLPPAQATAAMQSINRIVLNPWFLGAFFGTALVCAGAALLAVLLEPAHSRTLVVAGAALYLFGTILVTIVCNVPRNEALARVIVDDPAVVERWRRYSIEWTNWNHVRTAAALAAAVCFATA